MSMTPAWQKYLLRVLINNYNPEYAFIDNLGFELTPQDLTNIKIHKRKVIHGLEFLYIAPDIVIYMGGRKYVVATLCLDYNEWYLYKWDDTRKDISLIKVI